MPTLLLDAASLAASLSSGSWLVLDVRHALTDPDAGHRQFLEGHIPGAVFLHQDNDLAGAPTGHNGRHPLPDPTILSRQLTDAGLAPNTHVVVYDADTGAFAARAWWLLRWLGHDKVSMLDGGWRAWQEHGGTQEKGPGTGAQVGRSSPASAWTGSGQPDTEQHMPTTDASMLEQDAAARDWTLVDARDAARYRGEQEPIDPVAGHIPGASNRPATENLTATGRFKSPAALKQDFAELLGPVDAHDVVHYCGSGIFACHNLFAMELAGLGGSRLYPGSWSDWCSDPERPVATG
ncbi:MAG TPA: sulfurtransferase [Burkholderiaceae bacterium]|nr:sulfurtransferase [Burkholderiaceae bacterium]